MNLARPQALKHCGKCHKKIVGFWQEYNDIAYHPQCFECDQCHLPLGKAVKFVRIGSNLYCRSCRNAKITKKGYRKELPADDTKQASPSTAAQKVYHSHANNNNNINIQLNDDEQQKLFSQPMALTTNINTIYHRTASLSVEERDTVYNPPLGGFEIAHKLSISSDGEGHKQEDNLQQAAVHNTTYASTSHHNEAQYVQTNSSPMKEIHSKSPPKQYIQTNTAPMKVTITSDNMDDIDHKTQNAPYHIQNHSFGGFDKKHIAVDDHCGRIHSYSTRKSTDDITKEEQQHTFLQTVATADKDTMHPQEECSAAPHMCHQSFGGFEHKLSFEIKRVHSHSYTANNIGDDDTITKLLDDEDDDNASWIPPPPHFTHNNINNNDNTNTNTDAIPPPPPSTHSNNNNNNNNNNTNDDVIPPPPPCIQNKNDTNDNTKDIPPPPPFAQDINNNDLLGEQTEEPVSKIVDVNVFEEVYEEPTDPNNVYRAPEPVKKKEKKKKFRLFR